MKKLKQNKKIETRVRLSMLWIVVMLNMIYADIYSIIVALVTKQVPDIPFEVKTMMAFAAIITNIPILMVYFSRVLNYPVNRRANIIAGLLTIIYIIGGGDTTPHYIIVASIEIFLLFVIIWQAWKWKA